MWELDEAGWTRVETVAGPAPLVGASRVYDETVAKVLRVSGFNGADDTNDTWAFDPELVAPVTPDGGEGVAPSARHGPASA